jgi:hypothetical protein
MLQVYCRGPDADARYHWGGSHPVSLGHAHGHAQPTHAQPSTSHASSGSRSAWRQAWPPSVELEQLDYPQGAAWQEPPASAPRAAKAASAPRADEPDPPLASLTQGPVPTSQTAQAGTPVHERLRAGRTCRALRMMRHGPGCALWRMRHGPGCPRTRCHANAGG